jgi:hypothetical protein
MRTDAEIQAEIDKLLAIKPKVRRYSFFNDDNHAAIDVQVRVLAAPMGWREIDEKYGDDQNLYDNARDAREWMEEEEGADDGGLANGWQSLVGED